MSCRIAGSEGTRNKLAGLMTYSLGGQKTVLPAIKINTCM